MRVVVVVVVVALHLLLISFLSSSTQVPVNVPIPGPLNDDVLGLIVFKSSLQDPNYSLSSWNQNDDTPCNWPHVQCDPLTSRVLRLSLDSLSLSGHIDRGLDRLLHLESLSLSNNNLSGDITPHLSLLPRLNTLDLSRNAFSGRIPSELGSLASLYSLDLSRNSLSGPVPDSLFSPKTCSSLRYLSLAGNLLEGPLPPTFSKCTFILNLNLSDNQFSGSPDFATGLWSFSGMRDLDLSHNSFSGPVPDGITNLRNLKTLHLNGNRFLGTIPVDIGLCLHLNHLDLSDNSFTGPLPDSMKLLGSLSFVSLSNNQLSGDLPTWIGNLSTLQHMDLTSNRLTGNVPASLGGLKDLNFFSLSDNMLGGVIPASLAECTKLNEIQLKGNRLNGSIPKGLFDLALEVLDLSSNRLTGSLPSGSTRLSRTLHSLDLSNNQLTGNITLEMTLNSNLRYLNISWNDLRSTLPPELGYSRNLSVVDLRNCGLYGSIPGDLCDDSNSLAVLQLDGNSLSGPIPEEIGNCSSLFFLSLSHNSLNGSIPVAMSRLKKLEILKLEFNELSGEIPQLLGSLDNLLAVNISHNRLVGRLPVGGIFQSLDQSALQGNLGICSPLVRGPCKMNVPKPLVLDPNAYNKGNGDNMTSTVKSRHRKFASVSTIVAISAALVIVLGVLVVSLLNISTRKRIGLFGNAIDRMRSSSTRSGGSAVGKLVVLDPGSDLGSEDLVDGAESLLSKATEIGRGVFGILYKASLAKGRTVAIKKLLTCNIIQYHDDFDREVCMLGKAMHPNLMSLEGYYWTPQLQLLISDYAVNGSLNARLHEKSDSMAPLSWANRFKIALGTAKGLAHLHELRPPIIHYNLKPSNILLDENCNPKVSDFGLAKLLPKLDKHIICSRFQGALGYVAPELSCQSLRINEKCDVYGFGVLVLELVTGRKAVEYGDDDDDIVILIDQVKLQLEEGNVLDCMDPSMGKFPDEEVLPVLKLGLVCTSQIPSSRPSMAEVVQILQVIKTPIPERMEVF